MNRIFQHTDNEEKWYRGIIEFTKIDKEECNIMVFNTPYGYDGVKSFSGRELSFEEFKEQYPNAEFEVVTEGYCGYDTTFQGYRKKKKRQFPEIQNVNQTVAFFVLNQINFKSGCSVCGSLFLDAAIRVSNGLK